MKVPGLVRFKLQGLEPNGLFNCADLEANSENMILA